MLSRLQPFHGLCGLVLALVPAVATAAPVAPGGSVNVDFVEDFQLPSGEQLAQKVIDFTIQYTVPPGMTSNPPASTTGTLTTSVYRGSDGSGLVFVYDVDVVNGDQYVDETSLLTVGSFAGFGTDVTGQIEDQPFFRATRSADGATISSESGEGVGGAPTIVVETDATEFNDAGTARYTAGAEFVLTDPNAPDGGPGQVSLVTTNDFTGVYQPIADDGGPGPTPNPIPLPPAAWAALVTMGAFGTGSKIRRRFRSR